MSTKRTDHSASPAKAPRVRPPLPNTTDATQGLPLAVRAEIRRDELRELLGMLPATEERMRSDIEIALASVDMMLTGDVEHLSEATAAEVNRWLEGSKHLGELAVKRRRAASTKH